MAPYYFGGNKAVSYFMTRNGTLMDIQGLYAFEHVSSPINFKTPFNFWTRLGDKKKRSIIS